jgi:hypothetical protein
VARDGDPRSERGDRHRRPEARHARRPRLRKRVRNLSRVSAPLSAGNDPQSRALFCALRERKIHAVSLTGRTHRVSMGADERRDANRSILEQRRGVSTSPRFVGADLAAQVSVGASLLASDCPPMRGSRACRSRASSLPHGSWKAHRTAAAPTTSPHPHKTTVRPRARTASVHANESPPRRLSVCF